MRIVSECLIGCSMVALVLYGLGVMVADTSAHYSDFDRALMRELVHNHTSTLD